MIPSGSTSRSGVGKARLQSPQICQRRYIYSNANISQFQFIEWFVLLWPKSLATIRISPKIMNVLATRGGPPNGGDMTAARSDRGGQWRRYGQSFIAT